MLTVNHLTKLYPGTEKGIRDLSLHVAPGDLYAFIGHNGAGKTTTLKAVSGIHSFDAGEILIDGISLRQDPETCKRNMAYIPDDPDLFDYLTGIQYLNFVGDIYGIPAAERKQRISDYGDRLEIREALGDLIGSYSHGMKQKLAILSAFLHCPRLLILDEPFVGLDPKAVFTVKTMMRELCSQGGAVFFSTHVLEVAEKLCDKVAVIKEGRLILSGTMEEVLQHGDSLESVFMEVAVHADPEAHRTGL